MAERKTFPLRLPPELVDELTRWADDELRSLNAQIEYVLREAVRRRRKMLPETEHSAPGRTPGERSQRGGA